MEAWLSTRVALWQSGRGRENEEKEPARARKRGKESDVKRWWSWGGRGGGFLARIH